MAPTVALTRPGTGKFKLRLRTTALWGGGANQLLVLGSRHDRKGRTWLHVLLPVRPNGSTAWIPRDRTVIGSTTWRIVVSTGQRKVRVYRSGRLVRTFLAVVGAPGTPTPYGHYAIYEKIAQRDPNSIIGPWALHLTAFSNVLDNFGGGPGRVAIHGRNGAYLIAPLGTRGLARLHPRRRQRGRVPRPRHDLRDAGQHRRLTARSATRGSRPGYRARRRARAG